MKKNAIIAIALVALLLVAFAGFAIWGAAAAKKMIEARRHNIAGLALGIASSEVSWGKAQLVLRGITIYPAGHEDEKSLLASAEELLVRVAPWSLLHGRVRAREIKIIAPSITYVVTGKTTSNWDVLDFGGASGEAQEGTSDTDKQPLRLVVDEVKIEKGTMVYLNPAQKQRLTLTRMDIEMEDLFPHRGESDLPTSFQMTAGIGDTGGTITVHGKGNRLGDTINVELTGELSSTPLRTFAAFYAGSVPYPIAAGSITMSSRATVKNSFLTSTHHATIAGLRIAGGIKAHLINKYVLSQSGPLGVNASVNGDLSTGDLSISATLSKNLADEVMRRAVAAAPELALETVKKTVPSPKSIVAPLEKGVKGLLK